MAIQNKVLSEKTFGNKKQITKQYFKPNKEDTISMAEVGALIDTIKDANEASADFKIMVRGLAPDKWVSLKGFNTEFDPLPLDEYLQNKVIDKSVFEKFFQLQITTIQNIDA